jgi:hypothetical protein
MSKVTPGSLQQVKQRPARVVLDTGDADILAATITT